MIDQVKAMGNKELLEHAQAFRIRERHLQARLLACLSEIDERRLYAEVSSSMFDFLTSRLGYSEGSAAKRIQVMRAARKFPSLFQMIEAGELCLRVISLLSPHLTDENFAELIQKVKGLSCRKVELLMADYRPQRDRADTVRARQGTLHLSEAEPKAETRVSREKETPLTSKRVHFSFTGNVEVKEKLDRAKKLLRSKFPDGKMEDLIDAALDALLDKVDPERKVKQREARRSAKQKTEKKESSEEPAKAPAATPSRYIPCAVEDQVRQRDGHQCTFVFPDGTRCSETVRLQLDHIRPVAWNGMATVDNLRLCCAAHNILHAKRCFGEEFMRPITFRGSGARADGANSVGGAGQAS